eukprot:14071352-Ditylum_brightwellii.AAC.1
MEVTVAADILTINGARFFISMSRGIKFITGEYIGNGYDSTLLKSVESIKSVYAKRGFRVKHMSMDGQFKCLRERLTGKG